jgi:hypothetical protein
VELLLARNPDPGSTLPFLLRVPLGAGLVFRTKGTWPRTSALYCHPVPATDWPTEPELVERVPLRACARRGAAIDVVADRGRENRSQIVFTTARGREVVFWQSPRTRRQARPDVRLPTARAAGIAELEVLVDAHERYPYTFAGQQVRTRRHALPCGDYAVQQGGRMVAAVERKSLPDLVSSLTSGRLRYALGELAALARAAVVVEDRYRQVFHPGARPPGAGRRRAGRAAGPLAHDPAGVLRDPQARRGVDLPLPRRRLHLDPDRRRGSGSPRGAGRSRRRPGRPRHDGGAPATSAQHRGGPGLGPRPGPARPRPRSAPPRGPRRLARRPPPPDRLRVLSRGLGGSPGACSRWRRSQSGQRAGPGEAGLQFRCRQPGLDVTGGDDVSGHGQHERDEQRADRRAHVLLELEQARARRRTGHVSVRLPRSRPIPPAEPETEVAAP